MRPYFTFNYLPRPSSKESFVHGVVFLFVWIVLAGVIAYHDPEFLSQIFLH